MPRDWGRRRTLGRHESSWFGVSCLLYDWKMGSGCRVGVQWARWSLIVLCEPEVRLQWSSQKQVSYPDPQLWLRVLGQPRVYWKGYYGRWPYLRIESSQSGSGFQEIMVDLCKVKVEFQMASMCLCGFESFVVKWILMMGSSYGFYWGFYVRKVRRPPPSHQMFLPIDFTHKLATARNPPQL